MWRMLRCVCDVAVMYLVGGFARTWVRFFILKVVLSIPFSLVKLALTNITLICHGPLHACFSNAIVGFFLPLSLPLSLCLSL